MEVIHAPGRGDLLLLMAEMARQGDHELRVYAPLNPVYLEQLRFQSKNYLKGFQAEIIHRPDEVPNKNTSVTHFPSLWQNPVPAETNYRSDPNNHQKQIVISLKTSHPDQNKIVTLDQAEMVEKVVRGCLPDYQIKYVGDPRFCYKVSTWMQPEEVWRTIQSSSLAIGTEGGLSWFSAYAGLPIIDFTRDLDLTHPWKLDTPHQRIDPSFLSESILRANIESII